MGPKSNVYVLIRDEGIDVKKRRPGRDGGRASRYANTSHGKSKASRS